MPPRDSSGEIFELDIDVNVKKLLKENEHARDYCQWLREAVNNSADAEAKNIFLAPLPHRESGGPYSFLIADDGRGMSRPFKRNEHTRKLEDSEGKYPGLAAFVGLGMSTKSEDDLSKIGNKGLGSKLFRCARTLKLFSKQEGDKSWAIMTIMVDEEDRKWEGKSKEAALSDIIELLGKDSRGYPKLEGNRQQAVLETIVKPILGQNHGTLIFLIDIEQKIGEYIENFDLAIGDDDPRVSSFRRSGNKPQGDDKISLKTYLRHCTYIGNPFVKEALSSAGFNQAEIDEVSAKAPDMIKPADQLPNLMYLTKGETNENWRVENDKLFSLKIMPKGWNYVSLGSYDGLDSCASTLTQWKNSTIQCRYVNYFGQAGSTQFGLALAVDGTLLKNQHYTMLNRKGGRDQLRNTLNNKNNGMGVGDVSGVVLFSRGVYVCNFNDLLNDDNMSAEFKPLGKEPYLTQISLYINGDFTLDTERSRLVNASKASIARDVVNGVKAFLEKAKRRCPKFAELVKRAKRETSASAMNGTISEWKASTDAFVKQPRIIIQLPSSIPSTSSDSAAHKQVLHHMVPQIGEENSVITLYSMLSALLQDSHFLNAPELEEWWPWVWSCSSKKGLDAKGVRRDSMRERHPDGRFVVNLQDGTIPLRLVQAIEFKLIFNMKGKKASQNNDLPSSYNHSFLLTDYIIAWDLVTEVGSKASIVGTQLKDVMDNFGTVSDYYKDDQVEHRIPEVLKGQAFFITSITNGENDLVTGPDHREGHKLIRVVSLRGLLQATFTKAFGPGTVDILGKISNKSRAGSKRPLGSKETDASTQGQPEAGKKQDAPSKDMMQRVLDDDWDKVTINQLKDYLREHGQKLSGKKSELVNQVSKHVKEQLNH